ncbi:lycopene cyclase domain-containing protein [Mycobacterium spongiae]|uniref:Lycopene cyclase domain-containing protein n=1 Tax=Mycobacterium spongiae TaxID=886343 RepID=A0A975K1D8_9MYCO|nr:lycopene cyclase domain-containing protein [Mycobacterium spongiae]QUR69579.1 lycopene cyclase domain-containing protein [Mycobacterium spongiae]
MSGLGYTVPVVLAVVAVCALELVVLRTGLFRRLAYWLSMVIVLGFQVLVDGWLTKLSSPVFRYNEDQITGLRFPFDIPIEDFLLGFAVVTAVLLLWERQRLSDGLRDEGATAGHPATRIDRHGRSRLDS